MVAKQKSKKKEVVEPVPEEEVEEEPDVRDFEFKEFDLINDLNDEFFTMAHKTIQTLVEDNKMDIASDVKQYVTVLNDLHQKYVNEVNEKNEMKPKLVEADNKLNYALKITGESQEVMNSLKLSLENAWREGDASRTREQGFQDQLREMIVKCDKFTKKEQVADQDDAAEFGHLAKHKHIILKERDRLNGEVMELQKRVQMQRAYIESLEKVWQNSEEANYKTNRRVEALETEKSNLEKRIRIAKDVQEEMKDANRSMSNKNEILNKQVLDQQSLLGDRSREIDKLRVNLEKTKNENSAINKIVMKYKGDLNIVIQDRKTVQELYKNLKNDFKTKVDAALQLSKKYKKVHADYDNLSSRVFKMDKMLHNLKEENVKYKNTTNNLEKTLLENATKYENLRRLKDITTHERDNLRTDVVKLNNQINELKHSAMLKNNLIDNLHLDIQKNLVKMDEVKKQLSRVERERDEQTQEVQLLQDKILDFQEQLQLKIDQITELNDQLLLKQNAYIKIQKLLETTNSERIMAQRSLQSCCEERSNLKLLLGKNTHQIAQLTEEITANQNSINSLNLQIEHLRSEKQEVETELRTTKDVLRDTRQEMKELKNKNEALQKTIADDELRFLKLSIRLDDVRKEKNLIGLQMVRRNDEIILVKEKLSIFQTALDRGQIQYNQRMEDIRLLKLEVANLQTQRDVLTRGIQSTADMREEVVRLQRSLNQEKIRNRVLTEDLQTPANVHRWRILGGTDPDRFALIEKVQVLQKKILKQNMDSIQRENTLQESHKLYMTLKGYMSKLPTYKVKQDLVLTQRYLRTKDKKLKALAAELTTKEMDVKARECVIGELQTSLVIARKDLLKEKKSCAALKEKTSDLEILKPDCETARSV